MVISLKQSGHSFRFFKEMIKYHINDKGANIAELLSGSDMITSAEEILDLIAEASYNGSNKFVVYKESLHPDFFDLKTKMAGEILQKFSNYRMKLAIVGDFSGITSRSLNDFIRESNRIGIITFVDSLESALAKS